MDELERGREAYRRRTWLTAYKSLYSADDAVPLAPGDLELLATSAYLIGHNGDGVSALNRAYHMYLNVGEPICAARCAFWLGLGLMEAGQTAHASGWFNRGRRLLERTAPKCVEQGYLLIPVAMQQFSQGEYQASDATATVVMEIGDRLEDFDLVTFALQVRGLALVKLGWVNDGLTLLDEAMAAVVAGELSSPLLTGLIYCNAIKVSHEIYELARAREWTAGLVRWREAQPEMVRFTDQCTVFRAEILHQQGAWRSALKEASWATERFSQAADKHAAIAFYRQGEVYRLLGEFAAAEDAFRRASQRGWQPQPGLALLRLTQGRTDAASAAIRRVVSETTEPFERARLLPAYVEIMLGTGEITHARDACRELTEIAEGRSDGALGAMAAHARGAVELANGNARMALISLRHACQVWQNLGSPYEVALVRVAIGLACHSLGDNDGADLELDAARDVFLQLGAVHDVRRHGTLAQARSSYPGKLTSRELQVLRLVAAGTTNKVIATQLMLSERTIDRHVSNILTKLSVPSRAAATAYAYQHRLV
jgi:DNA-binding CsgD family transcriptional regulator